MATNVETPSSDEKDHSERTKTFTLAAAVAAAVWQMGIALEHSAVEQLSDYFTIRAHVEQLLCESNRWVRGDLTDHQRLFIDHYLHQETVRFLATSLMVHQGELPAHALAKWMDPYHEVRSFISTGGTLPKYEPSPAERAQMLEIVLDVIASDLEFAAPRATDSAQYLDSAQYRQVLAHLAAAQKWISELEKILDDNPKPTLRRTVEEKPLREST